MEEGKKWKNRESQRIRRAIIPTHTLTGYSYEGAKVLT